jgi:hypothetical protein
VADDVIMKKAALFVVVLLVSIGGGFIGGYAHHARSEPASIAPIPAADLPIDEVVRKAKDLVVQEMRDSFRERVSQARDRKQQPEKKDVSDLPVVEIEDFRRFAKELEENEVAFFAKYGNKRVRIGNARVEKVEIASAWEEYAAEVELTVPTSEGAYAVSKILKCRTNGDQLDAASNLKQGEIAVVIGVPTKGTAWPTLGDCIITVVEK